MKTMLTLMSSITLSLLFAINSLATPVFVDLSTVANISRDDDGIAGNRKGGWSDEGINDMFLHPPVPVGQVERNGYHFNILDPDKNNGMGAIMLRGTSDDTAKPVSVKVDAKNAKGRFVYFIQNATGGHKTPNGATNAVYSIHYSDGKTVDIPMQKNVHLRDWWTKNWWDNNEADSWPVHIGRNLYTMKWRSFIGIWATQWKNPHPETPISAITFASTDSGAPVIWAVTIDDDDYRANPEANKSNVWGNPPSAPEGYFKPKLALEREAVYNSALENGFVKGIRAVDIISPDLLAVTIDPSITRAAAGPCNEAAAKVQVPKTFTVTSKDDKNFSAGAHPVKVGRDSYEYWNGDIGEFKHNSIYWHTYYLQLPSPLQKGCSYEVKATDIATNLQTTISLLFDEAKTQTPVIKVNQVAYSVAAKRRYAYLGWWAGDLGTVDYSGFSKFEVIQEPSGKIALQGELELREDTPETTGEEVMQMDISALPQGQYHIKIPGLGRSASFGVGGAGIAELYKETQRAFYHQRCGFPLEKPYTTFEKPACHLWVYESGHMVDDESYTPKPNEQKREFRGGYHDAADYDCFTYHLRATAQILDAYEMNPKVFKDGDLNIPESGNKIPDILDEAEWALRFYREQQAMDGAVPKGRCNDQDSRRQGHVKWGEFGIFKPDHVSNLEYAAVAASFARLYAPYNKKLADESLASAVKAFDWAVAQPPDKDESRDAFTVWAATALFRASGDAKFNKVVQELCSSQKLKINWKLTHLRQMIRWHYVRCEQPGTDEAIRKTFRDEIIRGADEQLTNHIDAESYRWGANSKRGGMGWGNANGGGYYAEVLLRAWWLTGEQKYLDGASLNADFQLGCNPLSKTFISGMGTRPPRHPQISPFLYELPGKRGGTVKGITVFGISDRALPEWYPDNRPSLRRWRDLGNGGAEVSSEFTINETLGLSAMLYATLYAAEQK